MIALTKKQNRLVDFAVKKRKCGLFLPMDSGKTAISIHIIDRLIASGVGKKAIVIAPLKVARNVWQSEIDKWGMHKKLRVSVCCGIEKERIQAINTEHEIILINCENVVWFAKNWKGEEDILIIDESSRFKSSSSQRWRHIATLCRGFRAVILLTGTPFSNSIMEIWSQVYLLDQGERLGKNITAFRRRYFYCANFRFRKYVPIPGSERKIIKKISDVCIFDQPRTDKKPPMKKFYLFCTTDAKFKKIYGSMKRSGVVDIEGATVVAPNAGSKINKLSQISNGGIYIEKRYHLLGTHKIRRFDDLVRSLEGNNILVVYMFVGDAERIMQSYPYARLMDSTGVELERWNRKETKMLLVHPRSSGHGINAQYGGNVIIWYGLPWSVEGYQQTNGRLRRRGQTKTVEVYHLLTRDSVDEEMYRVLIEKKNKQKELLQQLIEGYKNG